MDHRIRRINRRRGESLANPAESKHQTCLRSSTSLIRDSSPLIHSKFHTFMIQDISGKFHRFLKIRTFLQKIAVAFVQMSNFICPSAQNVPTTHVCYETELFSFRVSVGIDTMIGRQSIKRSLSAAIAVPAVFIDAPLSVIRPAFFPFRPHVR